MQYDLGIHHRRSIRLKGYDYSQSGGYFVTIVTQNRECLFGDVVDREIVLNYAGKMVNKRWFKLSNRFQNIALDEKIVMPNHIHRIIHIVGATLGVALTIIYLSFLWLLPTFLLGLFRHPWPSPEPLRRVSPFHGCGR